MNLYMVSISNINKLQKTKHVNYHKYKVKKNAMSVHVFKVTHPSVI